MTGGDDGDGYGMCTIIVEWSGKACALLVSEQRTWSQQEP